MKNFITIGTRAAVAMAAVFALCLAFVAQPTDAQSRQPMNSACQITPLTDNDFDDTDPKIHNGQVVWMGRNGDDDDIYFWDGTITPLTDDTFSDQLPQIHNGQVVWQKNDGNDLEIYFWDGTTVIPLTDNTFFDQFPQISNGQVVWYGSDGNDSEIYLWEEGTTTPLTDNAISDQEPKIDNGLVVWTDENGINLWDGNTTSPITSDTTVESSSVQISDGQVVWLQRTDIFDSEVYLWNGTTVIPLTSETLNNLTPQIDSGEVVWVHSNTVDSDIKLWKNGITTPLTNDSIIHSFPQIDSGRVVWLVDDGSGAEVYLWDGVDTIPLTDNDVIDNIPQIDGNQIVWPQYDGNDYEIMLASCKFNIQPPVADAGSDIVVVDADNNGQEAVTLDASLSTDSDGTIVSYQWTSDTSVVIPDGVAPTANFPIGVHTVTLTVTDDDALSDTDVVTVTVQGNAKPTDLAVSGDLNAAPVTPTLHWNHVSNPTLTPTYRVYMQRNGSLFLNTTFDAASICNGTTCSVSLTGLLPAWGMTSGNYQWWVGALHAGDDATWSDTATFTVGVPPAAVPNPITVDDSSGQIVVSFPDDPNTYWVQLVIAGHPTSKYNQWHGRDTGSRPFTCDGTTCTIVLDWNANGRDAQGNLYTFRAWMQAWGPGGKSDGWNGSAPFTLPGPAVPDPITVNPGDGRIAVTFPNDPNTFWVQLVIAGHPSNKYNKWHGRNIGSNIFTCDATTCVIYPNWNVAGKDAQGNPYTLTVWMRAWGLGGMSNGWNGSDPFTLPQDAPVQPTNVTQAGGTAADPGFEWMGQPGSTWYHLQLRLKDTTTVAHSSWHLNESIGCAGALAEPDDYTCAVANLGLGAELAAGTEYDVFVRAWGPGGMGEFAQGSPFTYNP